MKQDSFLHLKTTEKHHFYLCFVWFLQILLTCIFYFEKLAHKKDKSLVIKRSSYNDFAEKRRAREKKRIEEQRGLDL